MNNKLFLTSIILLLTYSVNAQGWGKNKKVRGNGHVVTETRSTSDYDGIGVGGSFDVILVKGKEGKITLEGEENILPYIETKVKNGHLKIEFKKNTNIRTTRKLTVTVPFEDIKKLSLGGSGNVISKAVIEATDLKVSIGGSGNIEAKVSAETLKASVAGSGNIKLSGNANELKCSIAGSGDVKAYELETDTTRASIAGSGNVRVYVNTKIKASIAGSGSVYYKGKPTYVNSNSAGSGGIVDKN
ncbi:MAG: DUF2807 domain-containing protein [Flavobacteriaceae bacterium]|nr:MAG: DUF2807 domain-containing protein [Flavobacteriaceae bacterium]